MKKISKHRFDLSVGDEEGNVKTPVGFLEENQWRLLRTKIYYHWKEDRSLWGQGRMEVKVNLAETLKDCLSRKENILIFLQEI